MQPLNLPSFDCKIKETDGKNFIFDIIRKKYVVLTPEEWVRQHIINLLVNHLRYPPGLIRIEGGLVYNQLQKRSDILVYNNAEPYLLIECKSAEVSLDQKIVSQATLYNKSIKAPYMALSNGLKTFCIETDWEKEISRQITEFPPSPSFI